MGSPGLWVGDGGVGSCTSFLRMMLVTMMMRRMMRVMMMRKMRKMIMMRMRLMRKMVIVMVKMRLLILIMKRHKSDFLWVRLNSFTWSFGVTDGDNVYN